MTEKQIKRLKNWISSWNQEELKKDIEICEEYFVKGNKEKKEEALAKIDYFGLVLYHVKLATYDNLEILNRIKIAFNN